MYEGILPIWKEKGMTSHDVVFKLRKLLKMKKIGHTGTLDPEVEGVLLICLGKATKLVEFMMDGHKIYQGEICVGYSTTTEDATGEIIEQKKLDHPINDKDIDDQMRSFTGEIIQVPPMYSAVKVNGKKLYEYARQNIPVERPQRTAQIFEFKRTSDTQFDALQGTQSWSFYVNCGKGTYIRTLAVDLGRALGYPAHMSTLVRYATGGFNKDQTLTLNQVADYVDNQTIDQFIYPMEAAHLPFRKIRLTKDQYTEIQFGKRLPRDYFGETLMDIVQLIFEEQLIAIYYPHPNKEEFIKPMKMFI